MTTEDRLKRHLGKKPEISGALFVAPNATVIGDVVLGPKASVFYGAVLRGDINVIRVGEGTNIQDNAIVHLADGRRPHRGVVHDRPRGNRPCVHGRGRVPDRDGSDGPRWSEHRGPLDCGRQLACAPAVRLPARFPGVRVPARVIRPLSEEEQAALKGWAEKYVTVARAHAARLPGGSSQA